MAENLQFENQSETMDNFIVIRASMIISRGTSRTSLSKIANFPRTNLNRFGTFLRVFLLAHIVPTIVEVVVPLMRAI